MKALLVMIALSFLPPEAGREPVVTTTTVFAPTMPICSAVAAELYLQGYTKGGEKIQRVLCIPVEPSP